MQQDHYGKFSIHRELPTKKTFRTCTEKTKVKSYEERGCSNVYCWGWHKKWTAIIKHWWNIGDRCLHDYLMAWRKQARERLIVDAWRFEKASQTIKDSNVNRIGKIQQHSTSQCICEGMWLSSAKEVLAQNNIEYENFASAIKNVLILGRKKETFFCMVQMNAAKHSC